MNKKAFTLIELIVVISILAILVTIVSLSITDKVGASKDVARLSNLKNLSNALDLQYINDGIYPMPDNAKTITTDSGDILYYYGYAGAWVAEQVDTLKEAPKDPETGQPFAYAVTKDQKQYQVAVNVSSLDLSYKKNLFINQAFAGDNKYFVKVYWNFKKLLLTTIWFDYYLFYLPTMIIVDDKNIILKPESIKNTKITKVEIYNPDSKSAYKFKQTEDAIKINDVYNPSDTVVNFIKTKLKLTSTLIAKKKTSKLINDFMKNLKWCDGTPNGQTKTFYELMNCNKPITVKCINWTWYKEDWSMFDAGNKYFVTCMNPSTDYCLPKEIEWWFILPLTDNGESFSWSKLKVAPNGNYWPDVISVNYSCKEGVWTENSNPTTTKVTSCAQLKDILGPKDGWYILRRDNWYPRWTYCDFAEDSSGQQPECNAENHSKWYEYVWADWTTIKKQQCIWKDPNATITFVNSNGKWLGDYYLKLKYYTTEKCDYVCCDYNPYSSCPPPELIKHYSNICKTYWFDGRVIDWKFDDKDSYVSSITSSKSDIYYFDAKNLKITYATSDEKDIVNSELKCMNNTTQHDGWVDKTK